MKSKKRTKLIKICIFILIVLFIGIGGIYTYNITLSKSIKEWDDKSYLGVTIGGIDVGGKEESEIVHLLKQELAERLEKKRIIIKAGSRIFSYTYDDINVQYDFEKAAKQAIEYGKDLPLSKKIFIISNKEPKEYIVDLDAKSIGEELFKIEEDINSIINVQEENAYVTIQDGQVVIVPDIIGGHIELNEVRKKIDEVISGNLEEETQVELFVQEKRADIKLSDLERIKGVMSSFGTNYASSSIDRAINVELATSLVDGTLLMPGDVFSYSEVSQRGRGNYKDAPVYINNKVEQAEAGGICQVSTTLYGAVMKSNIRSLERLNHSLPVSYAKLGLDATVAWGSIDYKFKNTYDFPIYINGIAENGVVKFNIYGDTEALGNRTYNMVNEIVSTKHPTIKYIDTADLTVGTEVIEDSGTIGYKVNSYQVTYEEGMEVNRELIATDNYAMKEALIKRGTAPLPIEEVPVEEPVKVES